MATGKIEGGALSVNRGGTGATTAASARSNLGIPEPFNATILYTGSATTPLASGSVLTLLDNINNYKLLALVAFCGTPAADTRMVLLDYPFVANAHGITGSAGDGTIGSAYVGHSLEKHFTYINSTFSSFYLVNIYGIK